MLHIYKYFRLCYLYFEDHENTFFNALSFVNLGLIFSLGLLFSVIDFFWPGYLSLPDLSKPKLMLYVGLDIVIFHYAFKALLVKFMKVDPESGISLVYDYNPSPKAVKINFIVHILIVTLVILFGYLRKTYN